MYLWAMLDSLTYGDDSSMASTDRFLCRSSLRGDAAYLWAVLDSLTCGDDSYMASTDRFGS